MRKTGDAGARFPFKDPTTCYIEVQQDPDPRHGGVPVVLSHSVGNLEGLVLAATRARGGLSTLYAVWPGKRRSDLFEVNLRQMANAFNWVWGEEGTETVV